MKAIILLLLTVIALVSCSYPLQEKHRNAQPVMQHPRYKDTIQKLFPTFSAQRKRVFGGQEASLGQFPFQSLVYMFDPVINGWYMCGGSFVTPNWVLSVSQTLISIFEPLIN